jgi:hypothetical protein
MLTFETHDPNHNAETNPIKEKKKKTKKNSQLEKSKGLN